MAGTPSAPEPFTAQDARMLIELYTAATPPHSLRRTPWTWAILTSDQAEALARTIGEWVHYYNHVHAVSAKELIPPCWPKHPGLAHELAVLLWTYYHVSHDPKATPLMAAEYHSRYLTTFRARLDRMLGRDPAACRAGQHPDTWRSDADAALKNHSPAEHSDEVGRLLAQHFGFPGT